MKPRKSKKRWFWIGGILALVAGLVFVAGRSRATSAPIDAALIITVERRPLEVEVLETGRIQPREKADVKSKIAGQVSAVLVNEGQIVEKGQVLIVLDPIDYQRELAKADADVSQANAALDFARISNDRAEKGFKQAIMSRSDYDLAAHELRAKTVSVQSAEVARTVARDHVGYTKIVSPMKGTVIARGIEPGEAVVPGVQSTFDGKALLTIADLDALLVKVNLNQIDVAKVAVGRAATLTLDALPGHTYKATVTKVAPASVKLTGKDQEVFPVEASLETPDGLVKPGMTADVRIHLDAKRGVLVVPVEAIVKEGGKSFVMRVLPAREGREGGVTNGEDRGHDGAPQRSRDRNREWRHPRHAHSPASANGRGQRDEAVRFGENLRLAAGALSGTRGRSVLTVLSITIGAFAIVVMSSLAESGLSTIARGLEELGGARIVLVAPKEPDRGEAKQNAYGRGMSLVDRERVFRDLPHVEGVSMYSVLGKKDVLSESGSRASTDLLATDARFFDVFRMRVARGRAFTEEENRGEASLCVIGHKLAAKLTGDPLNRYLTVGALRCRVVGVLADNERFGVGFGFDWTDLVIAPAEAVANVDPEVRPSAEVLVRTDASSSNEAVKRLVNARLVARHPGVDDFQLFDFSGIMKRFAMIFSTMELIVALLAGIALVIGGVGVMNMMLVAVSERVKEIGLRKALGARPREIGAQFLTEAVLLALLGGGAGVGFGLLVAWGGSILIGHFLPTWQRSLAPGPTAAALVISIAIGVLFGWLPARQAARLDPTVAMRR